MRRLSAFLMIAALVAVLVPSAALAGKPAPPRIETIDVMSRGEFLGQAGVCDVDVVVSWSGRGVIEVRVQQWVASTVTPVTVYPVKKATSTTANFSADLGSRAFSWYAFLIDRKGNALDAKLSSTDSVLVSGECPVGEVASYDAP